MFIDTHCHLTDDKIKDRAAAVVESYLSENVEKVIDVGCSVKSSLAARDNSRIYESVFFAAGVHPSDSEGFGEAEEKEIEKLLSDPKCVALGEIGLDYYWKPYDDKAQKECFVRQLELAVKTRMPVALHVRDAYKDAADILKNYRDKLVGGIMHCYSGSKEMSEIFSDYGMSFSFGGTSTYKNAKNVREVVNYLPADLILTETDSPYLAPEGLRGTVNEPKNIPLIAANLASIKGFATEKFAEIVMENAKRVFPKLNV